MNSNKIWHPHLDLDPTLWWLWLNYPKEDKHKQDISLDEASTRQIQTVQDDIFSEARFRGLRDFKAGRKQVTLNRSWRFLCSLLERHQQTMTRKTPHSCPNGCFWWGHNRCIFFTWNMPAQITHLENGNSWLVTKLSPNNYIEIIIITTYNYPQLSSIIHNYSLKLFI